MVLTTMCLVYVADVVWCVQSSIVEWFCLWKSGMIFKDKVGLELFDFFTFNDEHF